MRAEEQRRQPAPRYAGGMTEPDPDTVHRTHFVDNRANWDDRATLHEASGYGIAELLASPTALTKDVTDDRERLGDLVDLDVIHLQCHLGLDTISLARLGARRVVGLDLSPRSLERARELARRAGARIELVESNVYAAREAVTGDFDLVYTTLGVLCWLPDIDLWARVVARLLRPGGRLVLRDDHPVFMAVGDDTSQGLSLHEPCFQQEEPMTWEKEDSYVEAPEGAAPITHTRSHQWNHAVGGDPHRPAGGGPRPGGGERGPCECLVPLARPHGALRRRLPLHRPGDARHAASQLVVVARRPGGSRP